MKNLPTPMIFMGFGRSSQKKKNNKNLSKPTYLMGLDRYGCVYGL
jgi:hypothetical protein